MGSLHFVQLKAGQPVQKLDDWFIKPVARLQTGQVCNHAVHNIYVCNGINQV